MGAICFGGLLLAATPLSAEEPAKKTEAVKPPWQRYLQGEGAKKAAEQAKRFGQLQEAGKFEEALRVAEALTELRQKVQGADHWQAVNARWVVAALRRVLQQGAETQKEYAGLSAMGRQAAALEGKGRYRDAQPIRRDILAIRRKVLGDEHPETATSYNNVASNLDDQGNYAEAEAGYRKALAIYRKALGEEHPGTATSYNNLAGNQIDQGKYAEAEEGYRKALAIRRKVLGEEHPDTALSYNILAYNQNSQGKYAEAETLWRSAAESFARVRLHIAATGLGRATITSERSPLPFLAAVLARNGKPSEAWQRFEERLARGTLDDFTARLRRTSAEQVKQTQLGIQIERLDKLIQGLPAPKRPTVEQTKRRENLLTQLRQAQDELAAFTHQLEQKYGPVAGQVLQRQHIQKALPADAALIGWLDIPGQPKAADPNGEHWAVLLRASGGPVWLRLRGSGDKDAWTDADTQLPTELCDALQKPRPQWGPLAERLRQQRLQPLAKHLQGVRRLIVLPSTALAGVPVEVITDGYTVSYAHSGSMYAHLRDQPASTGKGLFVLADPVFDTPAVAQKPQPLPSSGVLLTVVVPGGNAAQAGLKPNDVLLRYGDKNLTGPADLSAALAAAVGDKPVPVVVWRNGKTLTRPFSLRPGKLGVVIAKEAAPQALAEQRRLDRVLASRGGDGDWKRLPGTRVEAAALQRLLARDEPASVLLDSDASEQRLNELAQNGELGKYRYVHLATHGEVDNTAPLRSAVILSRDNLPDEKQRGELLLAGRPIPDGRLTAEEVLRRWNLHCDLVTLSACQTALGKYERGEGFVGFAQALILSGSRSVCLSLWKVDDAATALLMERFYQNLLGKREGLKQPMGKAAALAEAKSWLRGLSREEAVKRAAQLSKGVARGKGRKELPLLPAVPEAPVSVKTDRPYAHPYYWAAFVLIGDAD
jgi:tetratricopeptide (TPR) repeat protein